MKIGLQLNASYLEGYDLLGDGKNTKVNKADGSYLDSNKVELVLVSKAWNDHGLIRPSIKVHKMSILLETKEVDKAGVFFSPDYWITQSHPWKI